MGCGNESTPGKKLKDGISAQGASIKINHETSEADIAAMRKELYATHQAVMSDEGSKYFENGKVHQLKLSVKLPNGAGWSTQASNAQLKESDYGFQFVKKDSTYQIEHIGKFE